MSEGSSTGSAAGSARPGPEQAPALADEPAAIAPDPDHPPAGAPPAGATPPPPLPPPAAGGAGGLAGMLGSSTVRLGVAGAAAVLVLGLMTFLIGPGSTGPPPETAGSPASNSLNAPLQRTRAHRESTKRTPTHRRGPRGGAPRDVRRRARHRSSGAATVRGQDGVIGPPADQHSAFGGHAPALDRGTAALARRAPAPDRIKVAGHTGRPGNTNRDRPRRADRGGQRTYPEPSEPIGPPQGRGRPAP